ncbi:hypothetical protein ONS96_001965 [Cadophora gregata f. sp. sojae]|nr:hypothetical protein ONS96_001965 [Cadophora gregata f. sp. sojae]
MSTSTNPSSSSVNHQLTHASILAYYSRLDTLLKNLERDITVLEFQFRAGPSYIPPPPPPSHHASPSESFPSPSLSTSAQPPSTPYLPSLPSFPPFPRFPLGGSQGEEIGKLSQIIHPPPPPMYVPSMPLMPSIYVPTGAQMKRSVAQGREEQASMGSENENYDPLRSFNPQRGNEMERDRQRGLDRSILDTDEPEEEGGEGGDERGEERGSRASSASVDNLELYDPMNPMLDDHAGDSKPYDSKRFRRVSGNVAAYAGKDPFEDEIGWEEEKGEGDEDGDDDHFAEDGYEDLGLGIDGVEDKNGQGSIQAVVGSKGSETGLGIREMGPGYQTQVKDQEQLLQPGISSEARLKQKDTDSGHESGDQNQQSHVSYILIEETEEERDKRTESEGNIEDVAREDIDLDDQEMEIGYESEDQDQNSVKLSSEAREDKNRQTDLVSDQIDIAVEDEIEIELADYEMEIGYESDEQYQDSDISGKGVSEERTQTGEAVEDGIEFEAEPEEGFELNDQEMEINYETDDQEQHSQKTNESKDHEEQDSQTEIAEDARSPVNATSQQFWSQLVDSARTTSLSSKTSKQRQERTTKQFGSASHHGEGIGRYAKRVEERLERRYRVRHTRRSRDLLHQNFQVPCMALDLKSCLLRAQDLLSSLAGQSLNPTCFEVSVH